MRKLGQKFFCMCFSDRKLLFELLESKGSLKKKPIESLTAVKPPQGGGVSGMVVIVLRLFFPCSKPIVVPPGSPKKYLVFTLNSMYHIFSKLFYSQNLTSLGSHLIFVQSCSTVCSCFYGHN